MLVHLAIHRPRPGMEAPLGESMTRFGAAMRGQPGLVDVFALRDPRTNALVGLALWETKAHWEAARPAMWAAVKNDPFGEWEDAGPEVFHLEPFFRG